ncbi:ferredoxin [Haloarcula sp. CBA1130]|uniref:2Fe-2S iron-sulfur cluster-binding protein n=1 Tax=unclassified Haloarcula TaxID=2624677 RepID=UPI001246E34F|nr:MULTISPECIES: 2Fe-2S iron-sulfur cluster-binding protein [unclassified Haloarcula]KAA9399840.1 ferredoxin [Haloarcula sp. CBA1129]KAA9401535.1 ferredoxin [Haloarcula sp. CBA1130]
MTEVLLDWRDSDRTETVSVPDGETILDAAEAADIGLPFGCRTGACGTCTARLLSGDVTHRRPPRALKGRHLEAGYVLLCIAEPTTDAHLAVGATVQAELVPNPWK